MKINSLTNCFKGCLPGKMPVHRWKFIAIVVAILQCLYLPALAQHHAHDSTYYSEFNEELILRVYTPLQFQNVELEPLPATGDKYAFYPNNNIRLGAGFTYKWLSANLAVSAFPFFQSLTDSSRSKTLRLQTTAYGRTALTDLFLRYTTGFYQLDESANPFALKQFKPNMVMAQVGGKYEYMTNWKRFSLRGAFYQNEIQLKSAGSPLVGVEALYSRVKDEKDLLPITDDFGDLSHFNRVRVFGVGPLAGYGYTLVPLKRIFVTATASAGYNAQFVKIEGIDGNTSLFEWKPQFNYRFAAGYTGEKISFGFFANNNRHFWETAAYKFKLRNDQYRVYLTYRFLPGPSLKRILSPVDLVERVSNYNQ